MARDTSSRAPPGVQPKNLMKKNKELQAARYNSKVRNPH